MNKKTDYYLTQFVIDVMIKLAGVLVTSVATWNVAHEAFNYLSEPWLSVVSVGALILVEGAFIASWLAIDTQRNAPISLKVAWAATLITIYVALLVLSMANGEGTTGWAFRFVLAVMIGRSIYEAGVHEVVRSQRRDDRNIRNSYVVRRIERRYARENAIKSLHETSDETNYVRELQDVVERARLEAEHEAAMMDARLYRELLLERVYAKDNLARGQILASIAREKEQAATRELEAENA